MQDGGDPGLLALLDDFPLLEHLVAGLEFLAAKDVGVPVDQFVGDGTGNVVEVETVGFAGELGVEDDLQQQVAEFLAQGGMVAGLDGVQDFVGFLDQIVAQRPVGLFAVPRATVGAAEALHDLEEPDEVGSFGGHGCAGHHRRRRDAWQRDLAGEFALHTGRLWGRFRRP